MLYVTCTMISSADLAFKEYLVLKIGYLWIVVSVDCGTILFLFALY